MYQRSLSLLFLAAAAAACTDGTSSTAGARLAPMLTTSASQSESVPNEFVVVLRPGANVRAEAALARAAGARVTDIWDVALHGYAVHATPAVLASLRASPAIAYVQPNYLLHIDAVEQ